MGVILRVLYAVWFWPVNGGFLDSYAIFTQAELGVFNDPLRLPGYPFLVRIIGMFWGHVFAIVLVQFLMGFATAIMLYWVVWRTTDNKLAAVLPALYILVSGDQLLSEHSVLGEATMVFLSVASLTLWVVASRSDRRWLWLLPGTAFAVASTVRFGPIVLVAAVAAAFLLMPGGVRQRSTRAAFMVVGALPILLAWSIAQGDSNGRYVPGYSATGWSLYSRVAPFADCTKANVDADLRFLCESPRLIKDPDVSKRRGGPGFYLYQGGPAVKRFGAPTENQAPGAATLQRFALEVIEQQPLDYARVVSSDMLRYFNRSIGYARYFSGSNSDEQDISRRAIGAPEDLLASSGRAAGFTVPPIRVDNEIDMLQDWQRISRLDGLGLLIVVLLASWASLRAGRGRREAALLFSTGIFFLALPALSQVTSYRHSIPAFCLIVAAAAIGVARIVARRPGSTPPALLERSPGW